MHEPTLALELKDQYGLIYVMLILAEPSIKADRQKRMIQNRQAVLHPRQNKHTLYGTKKDAHLMKNKKGANREKGKYREQEEKVREEIRPCLSLHKFQFLF